MKRRNAKGMTLIDVLVSICLCVFLIAALVPAAGILDDTRGKLKCASNLKNIGAAFVTYANNNNGRYPRVYWNIRHADKVTAYTGWQSKDPFAADGVAEADVTASLYLLCRSSGLDPDKCICPDTKAKALRFGKRRGDIAAKPTDISNFPSEENLSYSLNNPYPAIGALQSQWVWDSTLGTDFPLVADMNPGGQAVLKVTAKDAPEALRKANSPNHGGAGQNVLYGDYHVAFQKTPFCGPAGGDEKNRDNIYTRSALSGQKRDTKVELGADLIMGPPTDDLDAVLLPPVGYRPDANKKDDAVKAGTAKDSK